MIETTSPGRRFSSATLALGAAGLLAVTAVGIAVFRSGDTAEAQPEANAAAADPGSPGTIDDVVASLQEQLRRDPDNHGNWFLLGMAYRGSERFAEAEQAFRRAMELEPDNADYPAHVGEALLLQGGDTPPPEAEQLFRRALELEPGNAQARYYLATLDDLEGEHQAAVDALIALLRDAPADAVWEPQVRQAVTAIAERNSIDIEGRLPPPPQPATSTATAAIPGPSREQMEAARTIPPSQQDAMVQGMVDRLASRLRQNPRDAEGWIRLMRSRMVLEDPGAAREALESGLSAFQDDSATQQRLRTAAQQLGVPAG
ncbi:tetratricopeptide repeat protein [Sphingosinicella sp. CPCC 101087]|uniref:tetratricopeptide repeat protein n=1 Tax=Sphingosinicella sp. CPCC 101087 TaxID=2497754 RepID=UPI0013EA4795|nr:tetratricopeptide repeat protein [Sphingosinicella sp. CPCC 101087]